MGKASKGGYYAVQKGKTPGVYRSWPECEAQTKGFAGAVYKKFDTEASAKSFVKGDGYGAGSSSGATRSTMSDNRYQPYAKNAPSKAGKKGKQSPARPPTELGPVMHPFVNPVFVNAGTSSGRKTVVYCDGSSIGNGKKGARAGWGVFFEDPELHHLNESRRLPGEPQTNNRAELMALIRAIQLCPNDGRQLLIQTDSQYSMDCVEKWISGWKSKGWKTSTGDNVSNKDLIVQLDQEINSRYPPPKLVKVKAHSGIAGNEIVDRMAKYGASLPESDSMDLTKRSEPEENHVHRPEAASFTINVTITPTGSVSSSVSSSSSSSSH
ncbi:Ribonuclease H domain protein [Kalmanozyma brasiliensis GHG001]|nr:Ribonuclease H domain protein [Kalmanozyma brasiliensis GHG001]KAF6767250.1 Ribonuclease H domain protein [Kalmanozyma brasiliensis GHG001]